MKKIALVAFLSAFAFAAQAQVEEPAGAAKAARQAANPAATAELKPVVLCGKVETKDGKKTIVDWKDPGANGQCAKDDVPLTATITSGASK